MEVIHGLGWDAWIIEFLVVDDEESIRTVLRTLLSRMGYKVFLACDGQQALDFLATQDVDCVMTDLRMPNMDGMKLLENLQQTHPEVPVVVLTAHGSVDTAVEAIKLGAFDFLSKGCDNDDVSNVVAKGARHAGVSFNSTCDDDNRAWWSVWFDWLIPEYETYLRGH